MEKAILIIDDEREIGVLLQEAFAEVNVQQVYSGKQAIEFIEQHRPNIILLDIQLPDQNGLDVLKQIRANGVQAVVVMITAFATVETAVEAMKIGANDFICKPFSLADVYQKVSHYLGDYAKMVETESLSLEEVEKRHIASILQRNRGNRKKTADDLGISLRTLYYKIKQYDLDAIKL